QGWATGLGVAYRPGIYTGNSYAPELHAALDPSVQFWISRASLPPTWSGPAEPAGAPMVFPLDPNGGAFPRDWHSKPRTSGWEFLAYATLWQFAIGWPTSTVDPTTHLARVLTRDDGTTVPLTAYYDEFDFDVSQQPDPASTADGASKT